MSIINGGIPVTGFIAPTDTTDVYPVIDPIYGIDGLRNVSTYSDRDNISLLRRREGMLVGVSSDSTYWKLLASTGSNTWNVGSASNWALFSAGGGIYEQYYIPTNDIVIIPSYSQYWIWGDLTVAGTLVNYGDVVIANGGLVISGGTFSNSGSISFVTIDSGRVYVTSSTIGFNEQGLTVSASILPNSLTSSHLNTVNGGATAGYLLSSNGLGNFTWLHSAVLSKSDKNKIILSDTLGNGAYSGLTISSTPLDGCYVAVFVNGQEFNVGDGVTSSACYFSNDGGTTARTFTSPNQIKSGDGLYWNGLLVGTDLYTNWRVSLYYLV